MSERYFMSKREMRQQIKKISTSESVFRRRGVDAMRQAEVLRFGRKYLKITEVRSSSLPQFLVPRILSDKRKPEKIVQRK